MFDVYWEDWPFYLVIGVFIFFFGLGGYFIYLDSKKPTFTLKKDEWVCTSSHNETYTTMMMVGKVTVPQIHTRTVCDVYTRH